MTVLGFALAGLLLLGYRYWPAVLLGSFSVNLFISFAPGNTTTLFVSSLITAMIAAGATLQEMVSSLAGAAIRHIARSAGAIVYLY